MSMTPLSMSSLSMTQPHPQASTRLRVTAVHENAMLTRMTALLGPHDIDHFTYDVGADGRARARAVVGVRGGTWQVDRVAARLARIVGVVEVS